MNLNEELASFSKLIRVLEDALETAAVILGPNERPSSRETRPAFVGPQSASMLLSPAVSALPALAPIAMFPPPVVLLPSALNPVAVFEAPVRLCRRACVPMAVS